MNNRFQLLVCFFGAMMLFSTLPFGPATAQSGPHESTQVSGPEVHDDTGVVTFKIRSAFTGGQNNLDVLLPDDYDASNPYRVLFILPVMPGTSTKFDDGMMRLRKLDVHNTHDLLLVRPRFDTVPWYGNHASNPSIRHERYMNEVIVPFIDSTFSTFGKPKGRLLIGYSKSGWGALSLILRNPEIYGFAAAWDNPLAISFGDFNTDRHFGTEEQFRNFSPIDILKNIDAEARGFTVRPRIAFLGKNMFGTWSGGGQGNADVDDTTAGHRALKKAGILHIFKNDLDSGHSWNGDWVGPAVKALMKMVKSEEAGERR